MCQDLDPRTLGQVQCHYLKKCLIRVSVMSCINENDLRLKFHLPVSGHIKLNF